MSALLEETDVRSYRGATLEDVLPQIVDEMGIDAVIVRQREGIVGGFGGFFGKRCVEVDVRPGESGLPRSPSEAVRAFERGGLVDAYDTGDLFEEAAQSPFFEGLVDQARPFAEHLEEHLEDVVPRADFVPDEPVVAQEPVVAREPEPEVIEPEPEPEPVAVAPQPVAVAPEPVAVEPEPAPVAVEPEPEVQVEAQAWAVAELASIKARLEIEPPSATTRPGEL